MYAQPPILQMPKAPLMFVDIEAGRDQAYIWLISVLIEGRPDSLRPFYAETPAFEKGMLSDFLSYRRTFHGCTICHYGGFDERLMLRQMATYGLDCGGLAGWFDLQSAIKKSDILPLEYFSLEAVAGHLGYEPRHPELDGSSVPWEYERVVCQRDEAGASTLREYGEDDVRAMQHIVSAMDGAEDTRPDRSWTASERTPPPLSFEGQWGLSTVRINPQNNFSKTPDPDHLQTDFDDIIPSHDDGPHHLQPQLRNYPLDPDTRAQPAPRVPGETGLFLSPIRQRDSGRWT